MLIGCLCCFVEDEIEFFMFSVSLLHEHIFFHVGKAYGIIASKIEIEVIPCCCSEAMTKNLDRAIFSHYNAVKEMFLSICAYHFFNVV